MMKKKISHQLCFPQPRDPHCLPGSSPREESIHSLAWILFLHFLFCNRFSIIFALIDVEVKKWIKSVPMNKENSQSRSYFPSSLWARLSGSPRHSGWLQPGVRNIKILKNADIQYSNIEISSWTGWSNKDTIYWCLVLFPFVFHLYHLYILRCETRLLGLPEGKWLE